MKSLRPLTGPAGATDSELYAAGNLALNTGLQMLRAPNFIDPCLSHLRGESRLGPEYLGVLWYPSAVHSLPSKNLCLPPPLEQKRKPWSEAPGIKHVRINWGYKLFIGAAVSNLYTIFSIKKRVGGLRINKVEVN